MKSETDKNLNTNPQQGMKVKELTVIKTTTKSSTRADAARKRRADNDKEIRIMNIFDKMYERSKRKKIELAKVKSDEDQSPCTFEYGVRRQDSLSDVQNA